MKNIYVIATDKTSRLVKQKYDTIDRLCLADIATKRAEYKRFNLFITSDEEIKDGDWYVNFHCIPLYKIGKKYNPIGKANKNVVANLKRNMSYNDGKTFLKDNLKKIILTTDQDLIKDGVQGIDDEFLEWFVKNPSCEKVEVEKDAFFESVNYHFYKIIIPKEEPKQETLEEACERLIINPTLEDKQVFKAGTKWQQEQDKNKYSEREVKQLLCQFDMSKGRDLPTKEFDEWFEKFKKK